MTKARKQANLRRKLAFFFLFLLLVNIVLKITGISTLDTSSAITHSHALGMKVIYFLVPSVLLALSVLFAVFSKRKSVEAESIEISGCSW